MGRKLATIQRIKSLEPIEGADTIEKITVLGWHVVGKKGLYKPGDLCIYCEIDSLMPEHPEFEFLKPVNMRIKTLRLRGQISQGICFPVSILDQFGLDSSRVDIYCEGYDVTELLGITKFEYPVPAELLGTSNGYLPTAVPSTSLVRIQNVPDIIKKSAGEVWYASEKLDGETFNAYLIDGQFGVGSSDVDFKDTPKSVHWQMARKFNLEEKLRSYGKNIVLQGELVGEGIRKNKLKIKGKTVYFFDAFLVKEHRFLDIDEFSDLMDVGNLELPQAPIISCPNFVMPDDINQLVQMSIGKSVLCDGQREGIVIAPIKEKFERSGRVKIKIINPEFLLKHKE